MVFLKMLLLVSVSVLEIYQQKMEIFKQRTILKLITSCLCTNSTWSAVAGHILAQSVQWWDYYLWLLINNGLQSADSIKMCLVTMRHNIVSIKLTSLWKVSFSDVYCLVHVHYTSLVFQYLSDW